MDAAPLRSLGNALVIGEALVDIVDRGGTRTTHAGGSPANVALGLGRLGVDVTLHTDLGRDQYGALVTEHLEDSGVRVHPSSFSHRPTSRAIATIAPDGSASYEFDLSWNPSLDELPLARVTHTGSIALFLAPGGERVRAHLAASESAEITLDPNIRPALLGSAAQSRSIFETAAALVTTVKLSDEDARWLYPTLAPEDVLAHVGGLGPRLMVMTLGGAGSMLSAGSTTVSIPALRVTVVDTIGAGDTFMASLIASLLESPSQSLTPDALLKIGRRAARAAAITVSRAGANLPSLAELRLR